MHVAPKAYSSTYRHFTPVSNVFIGISSSQHITEHPLSAITASQSRASRAPAQPSSSSPPVASLLVTPPAPQTRAQCQALPGLQTLPGWPLVLALRPPRRPPTAARSTSFPPHPPPGAASCTAQTYGRAADPTRASSGTGVPWRAKTRTLVSTVWVKFPQGMERLTERLVSASYCSSLLNFAYPSAARTQHMYLVLFNLTHT